MTEASGPPGAPHPTQGLNDTVHHRTRLGIMTVLHEVDRADFGYLRDTLNLTDGNLSRHLRTLDEAGYIEIHKGYHGRRPRTWLSLTPKGHVRWRRSWPPCANWSPGSTASRTPRRQPKTNDVIGLSKPTAGTAGRERRRAQPRRRTTRCLG